MSYDKFTYDLGSLKLTLAEKIELENEFDGEYMVCTDETADSNTKGEILSNLWAFRPEFLAIETGLPAEVFSCLQEKLSEDSNETVRRLVQSTCGEKSIVDAAVQNDGRGQFLAPYDGDEQVFTTKTGKVLYVYRC